MNDFMANARAYNIHYLFGYNSASSWEVAEGKMDHKSSGSKVRPC